MSRFPLKPVAFAGVAVATAWSLLAGPALEASAPWMAFLLIATAAMGSTVAVYSLPTRPPGHGRELFPGLAVIIAATAYAVIASVYAIHHHHNLGTTAYDLAIYDNLFFQSVHGKPLGTSLIATGYHTAAHFDPLLVLLSPLYLIYPRAELILILQSVWLASSAWPLYLLSRHLLGRAWPAAAIAGALLLHPAVHGANFYDFHSLTLIAPLFIWAIYFLESRATGRYWIAIVLLLMTREDIPLLTCFIGLHILMSRRSRDLGIMTIAVSIIYFALVQLFIMVAAGEDAHSYAYYYSDLVPEDGGPMSLIRTVITRPIFVVRHVFTSPKLLFLTTMYLPVLLLSWVAPRGKILMAYGLAVILLASRPALYSVHFQYTSLLYPAIFVLVPIALAGLQDGRIVRRMRLDADRLTYGLAIGIMVASVLVSTQFGGLVPNESFRSGFGPFLPRATEASSARYALVAELAASIPADASVAASRHLAPHVSNRRSIHRFPDGWGSDYLFIDRHDVRRWQLANYELLMTHGTYRVISERGDRLLLLQRVEGTPLPERLPR